jgi:hypothetical protein
LKTIILGQTTVSMMNPPNEGFVVAGETSWVIARDYRGLIVLRIPETGVAHLDFLEGMYMAEFCQWINIQAHIGS